MTIYSLDELLFLFGIWKFLIGYCCCARLASCTLGRSGRCGKLTLFPGHVWGPFGASYPEPVLPKLLWAGWHCSLTSGCALSPVSLAVQSTQLIDFWVVTAHLPRGFPWETFKTVPGQLFLSRFEPWKTLTHFLPQYQPTRCVITSQMQLSVSTISLLCHRPSCFLRYPCKVYANRREHIRLSDWSHWGPSSPGLEVKWQPPSPFPLGVMGQLPQRTTSS